MTQEPAPYIPKHAIRVITATALFDGHDAAINIMRRKLLATGVEVIHLGHNRSVQEIVTAAIEEDAHGIAVSSYQGGHVEFFQYMIDLLTEKDASHIKVFGGGGGVILPDEIKILEDYGVTKLFSPEDGARFGLQGIINHMVKLLDQESIFGEVSIDISKVSIANKLITARLITAVETGLKKFADTDIMAVFEKKSRNVSVPVVGITGTGGAGKSSMTDELVLRFLNDNKESAIAIVSCDPSRKKTGGALLGDRIRMNAIGGAKVYMRSMATRHAKAEVPESLPDIITVLKAAGYQLIFVETAGIGQGDSLVIDYVDVALYVMTSEYGAPSQLEKIDMLDFADLVAVNKYDKQGSEDAFREVKRQFQRNQNSWDLSLNELPVYGTIAARFNDDGVTALYQGLVETIFRKTGIRFLTVPAVTNTHVSSSKTMILPPERVRYLSEIAETVRKYHKETATQASALRHAWHLQEAEKALQDEKRGAIGEKDSAVILNGLSSAAQARIDAQTRALMAEWTGINREYQEDGLVYKVRGQDVRLPLYTESLARTKIPKVVLPKFTDPGETYRWMREENVPGRFPYTAGVFPLKRMEEAPTRMFAGEGGPERTNRRFKLLSTAYKAKRLSTAFDSVTLYGRDPENCPDIYGKIGTSGVSICTLDDMKALYEGFDLTAPNTSVSMTINGPAPAILAMYLNVAIDQQVDRHRKETGARPSPDEYANIRSSVLKKVRGTVQADILKEDQAQNTCIFSIDFAIKMMGDIQAYFIENEIRNFYSISISGYHIAEAGANPITQLAFTLANGFTYVEYYLARGMPIDSFAPNLSFFFSNGLDPEYTVIGRVARRIWAVAMKHRYGGGARSQMLKYHIQTSGRSLHSQDIQFNDVRTTLQALCAIYDNCNSLHTNAYDEAITTPTAESVRRALAIQMIINQEWGLSNSENVLQGSFVVEALTHLVEEAVLMEFDRISSRGGVLGAMETGYQRSKIQEESLYYEALKSSGEIPIIGVNTFIDPQTDAIGNMNKLGLSRATKTEKGQQLSRRSRFHEKHRREAPQAIERLKQTVLSGENVFAEMMETVRYCSLGQITQAFFEVGGQYRRNM